MAKSDVHTKLPLKLLQQPASQDLQSALMSSSDVDPPTWQSLRFPQMRDKQIGITLKERSQGNKNTKCPIDAHCHRYCRRDPWIQGLVGSESFELLSFLRLWQEVSQKAEKLLAKVEENLQNLPILCNLGSFLEL